MSKYIQCSCGFFFSKFSIKTNVSSNFRLLFMSEWWKWATGDMSGVLNEKRKKKKKESVFCCYLSYKQQNHAIFS